jgi:hypothetical protein
MERPDLFSSVAYWYQTGQAKRFATLPPAEERVVGRRTIELEGQMADAKAKPAETVLELQPGGYSGGKQIFAQFAVSGGTLTVPFKLDKALQGVGRLKLTTAADYGIWRVSLDGKVLPGLDSADLYGPAVRSKTFDIGTLDLAVGEHALQFECLGKNPSSTGYFLGVDALSAEGLVPYFVKSKP